VEVSVSTVSGLASVSKATCLEALNIAKNGIVKKRLAKVLKQSGVR